MNRNHLDQILARRDRNCCTMVKLRCPRSAVNKTLNKAVWSNKRFFKQSIKPVRSTNNYFTVFIQTFNVDLDCLDRVIRKTLT